MASHSKAVHADSVVVIGLGRFGSAVADSLLRLGHEVLGIDEDAEVVQHWATASPTWCRPTAPQRRAAPAGRARVLARRGRHRQRHRGQRADRAGAEELGVGDIWAKATTEKHGRILERTGAHHVVYPEAAMGERVAHLVTGRMIDFIEFDDGFAIAKTRAPREAHGKTLSESALRSKYGVTVVGVKRARTDFTYAKADTLIEHGDLLIVSGPTGRVETFAAID